MDMVCDIHAAGIGLYADIELNETMRVQYIFQRGEEEHMDLDTGFRELQKSDRGRRIWYLHNGRE